MAKVYHRAGAVGKHVACGGRGLAKRYRPKVVTVLGCKAN